MSRFDGMSDKQKADMAGEAVAFAERFMRITQDLANARGMLPEIAEAGVDSIVTSYLNLIVHKAEDALVDYYTSARIFAQLVDSKYCNRPPPHGNIPPRDEEGD